MRLFDPDEAASGAGPVGEDCHGGGCGRQGCAPEGVGAGGSDVEVGGSSIAPTRRRLRFVVAYDGSEFAGFAAQPDRRTVAGELARAIEIVARHPVAVACAGRTDAGVHASAQVVHADVAEGVDPARLRRSLARLLPGSIVVRAVEEAPPGFDARRSARARRYRYLVHEAPHPDPVLRRMAWHVEGPLELKRMRAGADVLVGEHDFRAFCRRPRGVGPDVPLVRQVLEARVDVVEEVASGATSSGWLLAEGRLLAFSVVARAFCQQMVRSLAGALVEVGAGRASVADLMGWLRAGTREGTPRVAPPEGLSLVGVDYS
jgi:tRNA pseudouridine38-40 synthase